MPAFRSNFLANLVGSGWTAAAQLLAIPIYVRLLGIEAYGLIGFYITLRAALQILDMGLATTINREMARLSVDPRHSQKIRNLASTFEICYWTIGILLAALLMSLAAPLARHWVHVEHMTDFEVVHVLRIMGLLIGLQWPLSLYQGGLMGLQHQVRLNVLKVIDVTLSTFGAVAVLKLVKLDVSTFFFWQIAVTVLNLLLIRRALWIVLGGRSRNRKFDAQLVYSVRHFAFGMSGISIFGLMLSQMDKIVLSKLLPLSSFGLYMLADTLASGLYLFITPVFSALSPRLAAEVAQGGGVRTLYHQATQLLSLLSLPAAALLVLCPAAVISIWTGDAQNGEQAASILSLLAVGTAINGLMHIPYALQLSFGWTRIGLLIRAGQLIVFLPLLIWAASRYGGVGAAATWAAANVAYLLIGISWTHRRLLRGSQWQWLRDVAVPAAVSFLVVWLLRASASPQSGRLEGCIRLFLIVAVAMLASAAVTPALRMLISRIQGPNAAL